MRSAEIDNTERAECLDGATSKIKFTDSLKGDQKCYFTINDHNGKPYEIFLRYDDADTFEWSTALTRIISLAMRKGVDTRDIIDELTTIHSPRTAHYIPGTNIKCPSLMARIGRELAKHVLNNSNTTTG